LHGQYAVILQNFIPVLKLGCVNLQYQKLAAGNSYLLKMKYWQFLLNSTK